MNLIHTALDIALIGTAAYLAWEHFGARVLARFEGSHEVDDITAGFRLLRDRLEAASDHHNDMADAHTTDAMDATLAAHAHRDEATRALATSDKLTAMIGA